MSTRDSRSGAPFGATTDAFELMKQLWSMGGVGPGLGNSADMVQMAKGLTPMVPPMMVPTFDVDELDKRITDLRAVEQWLQLNAGMLRTTIQTLEVQRATLAALKQFGSTTSAAAGTAESAPAPSPRAAEPAARAPDASWPPGAAVTRAAAAANETPPAKKASRTTKRAPRARANPPPGVEGSPAAIAQAPLNPAAWWNALQEQFTQIAAAAAAGAETGAPQAAKAAGRKGSRR